MKIKFKYNKKQTYTVKNNIVKIYSVPTEYQENGLFISDYSFSENEPLPECLNEEAKLLFSAIFKLNGDIVINYNEINAEVE